MKALQTPILILALFLSVFSVSQAATKKSVKPLQCLPDPALVKKVNDLTAKNLALQAQLDALTKPQVTLQTTLPVNNQVLTNTKDIKGCTDLTGFSEELVIK